MLLLYSSSIRADTNTPAAHLGARVAHFPICHRPSPSFRWIGFLIKRFEACEQCSKTAPLPPGDSNWRQSGQYRRPKDRRSQPKRCNDGVSLIDLHYRNWLDQLPKSLHGSVLHERLEIMDELDLQTLCDIEVPRGYGRD